jgi:hypothetical protein
MVAFAEMRTGKLVSALRGIGLAGAVGIIGLVPSPADAHIRLSEPAPRSQADNLKPPAFPPPCGNVPRGSKPTGVYKVGETIDVKWQETIGHTGCFQIGFSTDDKTFTVLSQINDPDDAEGARTAKVTLPAGVSCTNCTLQLRQLMLEGATVKTCAMPVAVPPDGKVAGTGNTYYSCADICVGSTCPDAGAPDVPDAGTDPVDDAGTSSGGVTTTPTDGGGKFVDAGDDGPSSTPDLHAGDGGGCSVALGTTSGVSLGLTAGLFGLALLVRRRNAKK